jgi:hypothetical protein
MNASPGPDGPPPATFRRDLGIRIAWTLAAKALALALLWVLFFRGRGG